MKDNLTTILSEMEKTFGSAMSGKVLLHAMKDGIKYKKYKVLLHAMKDGIKYKKYMETPERKESFEKGMEYGINLIKYLIQE